MPCFRSCSGTFSKKKKEEITALVLGGIAPDFDVFLLWINYLYPNFLLITHRGLTHSLIFGFLTSILIFYLASRSWVKTKVQKYIDFEPVMNVRTMSYAFAGVVIHLFLDYSTTRGVPIFYPLDFTRYSAEVFFYTDIYLTILSLLIVIYLYKKPIQKGNTTKFLMMFIIVFAGLGALRLTEKNHAEQFFHEADIETYPTMNPFDWYALSQDKNTISVFEYNGLSATSPYNHTVPSLNLLSSGDGLDGALHIAGELPQVKMFKWGAHTVAVNASFGNDTWSLEYYDPVQKAEMRESSGTFRRLASRLGTIKVAVTGGKAVVL